MGYEFDDREVQTDKLWLEYFTTRGENNEIGIKFENCDKLKSPIEISAFILHKLKRDAEEKLKITFNQVVVTVPAYFNSVQKAATKLAALVAGFEEVKLLNEPTAAALSYLPRLSKISGKRTIMVFDLGGGTFDVSIVEILDKTLTVKSVYGDSHLGGELFLRNMINLVKTRLKSLYPKIRNLSERSKRRIRTECEEAKKQLTFYETYNIIMDHFETEEEIEIPVSRQELDDLNQKLYDQIIKILKSCIENSGIPQDNIEKVLLVGGASFTPKIRDMLKEYFGNNDILETNINSDEAIAIGAAIQAYSLFSDDKEDIYVVRDVAPMSIGLIINDGEFIKYIDKNTPLPVEVSLEHDIIHLTDKFFQVSFFENNTSVLLGAKQVKLIDEPDMVTINIRVEEGEDYKISITGSCIKETNFVLQVRGTLDKSDIEKLREQVKRELINW